MCTRIFWNDNAAAQVVARTFDWERDDAPRLWALPRGLERDGGTGEGAARWTSRHGSVSISSWDGGTAEGVNEAGLAVHALYLGAVGYEAPDERPTVSALMWVQWALDRFATVAELLDGLGDVRVVPMPVAGQDAPVHFAAEDASGDSAIVELLDGRAVVHRGRDTTVMTNDPTYAEQRAGLAAYAPWGGERPLPGDIVSTQRFVRAAYFLRHLPEPADELEALAGVIGIARNVSIPYGAPDDRFDTYPTWWLSATDLTNRVLCFSSTRSPNVIWVSLDALDLSEGAPPRALLARDTSLVGDVSGRLAPTALPFGVPLGAAA